MKNYLENHKKSNFHLIITKTDNFGFCLICNIYVRKLNEVHEINPTHKESIRINQVKKANEELL